MTPLPEPVSVHKGQTTYTEAQLREYGAAEYKRAIEDAANVAASLYTGVNGNGYTETQIRKLGATP